MARALAIDQKCLRLALLTTFTVFQRPSVRCVASNDDLDAWYIFKAVNGQVFRTLNAKAVHDDTAPKSPNAKLDSVDSLSRLG